MGGEKERAELADEHLLQDPDEVPQWRDVAREEVRQAATTAEADPIHSCGARESTAWGA